MDEVSEQLSKLACTTCRKQKRKCTRELPSCHLCRKNNRSCAYPDDNGGLQAAVLLLAFYEVAHAIYPAAYLTIGHCARLGHALGIHDRRNVSQMFPTPSRYK
ncbi:hypothetical protein AUP68_07615 [Ilyonectria robusta]